MQGSEDRFPEARPAAEWRPEGGLADPQPRADRQLRAPAPAVTAQVQSEVKLHRGCELQPAGPRHPGLRQVSLHLRGAWPGLGLHDELHAGPGLQNSLSHQVHSGLPGEHVTTQHWGCGNNFHFVDTVASTHTHTHSLRYAFSHSLPSSSRDASIQFTEMCQKPYFSFF